MKISEDQAIQIFQNNLPLMEQVTKYGPLKTDQYIDDRFWPDLADLRQLWRAGYTGSELTKAATQAGIGLDDLQKLSEYLWHHNREGDERRVSTTRLTVTIIAGLVSGLIGLVLLFATGYADSLLFEIGSFLATGIGLGAGWLVATPLEAWYRAQREPKWPSGLYPLNVLD